MTNLPDDQEQAGNTSDSQVNENLANMSIDDYRNYVRKRRNRFLLFLVLFLVLRAAILYISGNIDSEFILILFDAIWIFLLVILIWLGYRVTTTECYKCGNKLMHGHFVKLKNITCKQCGFKFNEKARNGT